MFPQPAAAAPLDPLALTDQPQGTGRQGTETSDCASSDPIDPTHPEFPDPATARIGLGLALAQDKKVIAVDGDGSVLMNFGTLPTIANNPAPNFILLIIDNGSYGSTGDQTTYTGMKTSLADVARACGCDNVVECSAEDTKDAVVKALAGEQMTLIISKCESGNIKVPVIEMDPVVIKDRFMKAVNA